MSKPKRPPKDAKGEWLVVVRCTVVKHVLCVDCTEDEARADPFEHAEDETEDSQEDWQVTDVKPNA